MTFLLYTGTSALNILSYFQYSENTEIYCRDRVRRNDFHPAGPKSFSPMFQDRQFSQWPTSAPATTSKGFWYGLSWDLKIILWQFYNFDILTKSWVFNSAVGIVSSPKLGMNFCDEFQNAVKWLLKIDILSTSNCKDEDLLLLFMPQGRQKCNIGLNMKYTEH